MFLNHDHTSVALGLLEPKYYRYTINLHILIWHAHITHAPEIYLKSYPVVHVTHSDFGTARIAQRAIIPDVQSYICGLGIV